MPPSPNPAPSVAAILVAAGRGHRAGSSIPKQYRLLGGMPIVRRAARLLLDHPRIARVAIVRHPEDAPLLRMALDGMEAHPKLLIANGGASRQASVRAGLRALAATLPELVIVHDAARPLASTDLISATLEALRDARGAIAALPVADTLKRAGAGENISATVDRAGLWVAQTPQAFDFRTLFEAHEAAAREGREDFTDDASLLEWRGVSVKLVTGEADNFKLTLPEDFARAERVLAARDREETRMGIGFDVHAFAPGDRVVIGGVTIPHTRGVLAHSDGDVVLHALTDALLGALAEGDIGRHFPPSDPRWKDAPSSQFLAFAAERVRTRGGRIVHLDATVIAEAPRIGPHREAMRSAIAAAAGIATSRVAIKATTSETLGFTGRGEGLAALAAATIALPASEP